MVMRNLLLFSFFLLFTVSVSGQTAGQADTSVKKSVLIKLKDKSTIKGTLLSENDNTVTVQTAAGKLVLLRENISSLERVFEKYYRITLTDGSVFLGGVIIEDTQGVLLHTRSAGEVKIPTSNIAKKEVIPDEFASDKSFANPHSTRYLFSPTAMSIEKNEGYYQNIYFLYNSVHYGVSDHVSIGGGMVFPIAVFLTPKVSYEVGRNFHLGAGVLAGATVIDMTTFGIAYGLATVGNREHNFTIGGGYGYLGDEWGESPILTFSGMTRLGRNVSLITENWYLQSSYYGDAGIFSAAVRVLGRQHSVDFGIVSYYDLSGSRRSYGSDFFGIPYLGYVYKFGGYEPEKAKK